MRERKHKAFSRKKIIPLFRKKRAGIFYVAVLATIVSGAFVYQMVNYVSEQLATVEISSKKVENSEPVGSVPVSGLSEEILLPVLGEKATPIAKHFYDEEASVEQQQDSLIYYDNKYTKNTGTDFSGKDNQSFEVIAAISGEVTKVEQDSLLGKIIEVSHEDGLQTIYQSLDQIQVEQGDIVVQGEVIAKSGENTLNKDLGNHLHFEIRRNNEPINPETSFHKTIEALLSELGKEQ